MKRIAVLLMVGLLLASGCGSEKQADVDNLKVMEETESVAEEESEVEKATENESENKETPVEVFAEMPDEFWFSSGAGAWGTVLYLQDDGTFEGQYHDSDMGSIGDGYPNGTVYICNFKGKFSTPIPVSDYVYSTTIEYMETDPIGEEYIKDEIKYIVSSPYGLENAGEILFYLYGTPRAEIVEGFISWMPRCEMTTDNLDCYGIYNVNEETGFMGYKYEAYEELCKLSGTYANEMGSKVVIQVSPDFVEYSHEIGSVEWIPYDGEPERGSIVKNAKGGFTICLDESILYSFKMTKYESGSIEFVGDDKWSEAFGTFVMQ